MSCCDHPAILLDTLANNQALLVAVTKIIMSDPATAQAVASALLSSDPNNSLSLGSDGLLYENDSVV